MKFDQRSLKVSTYIHITPPSKKSRNPPRLGVNQDYLNLGATRDFQYWWNSGLRQYAELPIWTKLSALDCQNSHVQSSAEQRMTMLKSLDLNTGKKEEVNSC